ncbi:hypothetical protein FSP39_013994 [Pinctada imbricata]|uniref:Carboxylesterase type B domain-containing protein n=1 Tax=Pinctada imbricata TaxID=66713 RepID=A0AA88YGY3_PINIB|nr:hypothetical protein FSP39_013994 [Pinctada imbricata]
MSEDCLQLNIFVPYSLSNVSKSVMTFIHGGIYSVGSGTSFDGTMFTLRGNVILVTINYRLGPFGFLSTQDSVVPGNVGLWDQRLAFEWIKDNIHEYGGNPDSITLFGGSAGGGSVSFQSLYPGNRGLFQRVISMSGVAQSKIMQFDRESMAVATSAVLTRCNCLSTNTTKAIDCLRAIPAKVLAGPEIFKPIKDGNIIIHDFAEQLNLDKYSDVFKFFTSLDYMTGILNGDGNVELRLYVPTNSTSAYNSSLENGLTTEFLCDYFAGFISRTWYP